MAIDFVEIGERLRAYRMGAGLTPEDVAQQLEISRAALYKYEKGGVIKLETIEKLAQLLKVSVPSLLGVGVEYFANPVAYYERKRQLEERADQVIVYFEPLSFVLMSGDYVSHLRRMLTETIPDGFPDREAALTQIDRVMEILQNRHDQAWHQRKSIISLVSAIQVQRVLRTGLVGSYNLSKREVEERRHLARVEVERMAALMESEPIGVQIGVIEDTMPNQTFQIFREREKTWVAVSPFRLGEFPNIRAGVASITAAPDAVTLYEQLASDLWSRAYKGERGAQFLRRLIAESGSFGVRVPLRSLSK
ncbi:helix-turn-helix transcriptional regulator [Aquabacter sp. CN5-332]|uniref:helix-turn-helix domain-containing protein n=1 Tax=Aquabacter sp. CN5-332 TaxID=3156608 RepID=UPI0032B36A3B